MTSYTPEYLNKMLAKERAEAMEKVREERRQLLYRSLMQAQLRGIATEHSLIDCSRFWWYDGYEISPTYF
jgi:hypothetical protein